jgi:2'-5' RNA ligase
VNKENKRLFFGIEATSPWPHSFPHGRLIQEHNRHATLAFLGEADWNKLAPQLDKFPIPTFKAGLAGIFDKCLFLPKKHPHVVSWHIDFAETLNPLEIYQKTLSKWLNTLGFNVSEHEGNWLPHVTIARQPSELETWQSTFVPLPVIFKGIYLYQSVGNSNYHPLWSLPLTQPWDEIEHTADIAFVIRGESIQQIYRHAVLALAFKFPPLLLHLPNHSELANLDDVVILLNDAISLSDREVGCPFKAVSFHGELEKINEILHWEMIVDV